MLRWWCWQGPAQFDIVTAAATQFFMCVCSACCMQEFEISSEKASAHFGSGIAAFMVIVRFASYG